MAADSRERLYERLPAIYRERDAESGEALRALLGIIEEQADLLEADIRRLWDNFFVETCEPWVVPYIGDLVGATPLFDESRVRQPDTAREVFPDLAGPRLVPDIGSRGRADVAKTIYYRRRKGTLPMLEELARDVTGWGAHAVEFFELLGWTQHVRNHVRLHSTHGADVRSVERMDRVAGAFDETSHTADVRPMCQRAGWHNIRNVGFFLWRLASFEAEAVDARRVGAAGDFRYRFHPLGADAPLFSRWRREGDEAGLATELHVPGPIRPAAFFEDLRAAHDATPAPGCTKYYGLFDVIPGNPLPQAPGSSLMIILHRAGSPPDAVPPARVRCMDLGAWARPTGDLVGIDVKRGRIALGASLSPDRVEAYYHHGFSAGMGGGPYRRRPWLIRRDLADLVLPVDKSGAPGTFSTIGAALAHWGAEGRPNAIVSIRDNRTYAEALSIEPADGRWIAIEAADEVRPHLQFETPLAITGTHPDASVTLSGLLVEGAIDVQGSIGHLRVVHSTLVPGVSIAEIDPPPPPPAEVPASVLVAGGAPGALVNQEMRLEIAFSIVGPLRVPPHAEGIWALDSIVDGAGVDAIAGPVPGDEPGPPLWLERTTVFGTTRATELRLASEVIFDEPVLAERQQAGCVRFSFVPAGSATPRRYRCQPDLRIATETEAAEAAALAAGETFDDGDRDVIRARVCRWLAPSYSSRRYGQPPYAQLHSGCPREITAGAEDGSEMGAFCHLKQPQREANLRLRLQEYLPFGLEAGLIHVT
jgi:hypothetical protein